MSQDYMHEVKLKNYDDSYLINLFQPEFASTFDLIKDNLLIMAIRNDRINLAMFFIATGIFNLNYKNLNGKNAFYYSIEKNYANIAIFIIENGFRDFSEDDLKNCSKIVELFPVLMKMLTVIENTNIIVPNDGFKIYDESFFKEIKLINSSGGYGEVYMGLGIDGNCYALKISKKTPKNLPPDIVKEIAITKCLNDYCAENNLYPVTAYIYGIYYDKDKNIYLISEFLKRSLFSVLTLYALVPIELKRDYLLNLFKSLIEKVNIIHKCGWLHLDLRAENIMIDSNGKLRIIDFGLSKFIGLEKFKLKDFHCTWFVKPPDDQNEILEYTYHDELIFKKIPTINTRVNYSADLFSISCILLGAIFGRVDMQLLFTKNKTYYFDRINDSSTIILHSLGDDDINRIKLFYPTLYDFFRCVFTTDSAYRLTCNETLKYGIFSTAEHLRISTNSITDIEDKDSFLPYEIQLRLHELKYLN